MFSFAINLGVTNAVGVELFQCHGAVVLAVGGLVRVVAAVVHAVAEHQLVQAHEVIAHHVIESTLAMSGIHLLTHTNFIGAEGFVFVTGIFTLGNSITNL